MSNSAAMAASKRRQHQGPVSRTPQSVTNKKNVVFEKQQEQLSENLVETKKYTVIEILRMHDYKLYNLNKLVNSKNLVDNQFVTKQDLEQFQLESSVSTKSDNKTINKLESACSELSTLKTAVNTLNKSMQTANGLITMMKATLLSQANEIQELKQEVNQLTEEVNESGEEEEDDVEDESRFDVALNAETETATEAVTEAATEAATEVATEVAKEVAKEVATEVAKDVVKEPATEADPSTSNIELVIN